MTQLVKAYHAGPDRERPLGITLPVEPLPGLPETITLGGRTYRAMSEFHVTLLSARKIVPMLVERDHLSEDSARAKALESAIKAVNRVKPTFSGYLNDFRLVDRPDQGKYTVVVMARVNGLQEVFSDLNSELNLSRPVQPAHVTLFLDGPGPYGIALNDPIDLADFARPLDDATRAELTRQIEPRTNFSWSEFK